MLIRSWTVYAPTVYIVKTGLNSLQHHNNTTQHGNPPESQWKLMPGPVNINFVFFMLTPTPFSSIPSFYAFNLAMHSSNKSVSIVRSSAYNNFQGTPAQNWWECTSRTSMKRYAQRTNTWCTSTSPKLLAVMPICMHTTSDILIHAVITRTAHYLHQHSIKSTKASSLALYQRRF